MAGQGRAGQGRAGQVSLTFMDAVRSACALATTPSAAFTSFANSAALASAACLSLIISTIKQTIYVLHSAILISYRL